MLSYKEHLMDVCEVFFIRLGSRPQTKSFGWKTKLFSQKETVQMTLFNFFCVVLTKYIPCYFLHSWGAYQHACHPLYASHGTTLKDRMQVQARRPHHASTTLKGITSVLCCLHDLVIIIFIPNEASMVSPVSNSLLPSHVGVSLQHESVRKVPRHGYHLQK